MSEAIKEQTGDNQEVDVSISEDDLEKSLTTFVKGMNAQEMTRFSEIYRKFQDKGSSAQIKKQK